MLRGEDEILAIRNFGQKSLDELKEKLLAKGYIDEDNNVLDGPDADAQSDEEA